MTDNSRGAEPTESPPAPKYYVASKNDTYRNCQICNELYPAGTYKQHQVTEKHESLRRERRLAQNAQYQRNWRSKTRAARHAG